MTTQALVIDRGAGTETQQLQRRMRLITDVMANVLEEGKDYGRIPGTDKPTLYKPGAEKLMLTFALASAKPLVDDLSTLDEVRYRLNVPIEAGDGRVLAVGVGEASSNEEKYRWRKPVCDEEYDETPAACRREKWFRGQGGKAYKGKQIRTSPADLANTVLKMAHKRAFIHGTLLATGASSVFNQDLEDFTAELREALTETDEPVAPKKPVQRASASGKPAAAAKPAAAVQALVTDARRVQDVRQATDKKGKAFYILTLEGDQREYVTRDATHAVELEQFKGTDHLVRGSFRVNEWQGKTFYNLENFAIADAEIPQADLLTNEIE
jgi:hypothetical protein